MTARRLFLYMLGQLGIMVLARFLFQWILKFSDSPVGDGTLFVASAVGTAFLAFRIFDGVTDPMAGAASDWWVSKGRTRQSMLWASVFLPAAGLVLSFAPNANMPVSLRWLLLITGLFIFFVGYTLYAIPYWSLVQDYGRQSADDRRALSNMLGLGMILATIVGFVITPLVIDALGYWQASIVLSVFASVCMMAPIYAAPEGANRPLPASDHQSLGEVFGTFLRSFRNRRFVALLALLAGSQMSFTILTAAAPFIAVHLLQGEDKDVAYLLGPLILTAIPMFAFAPKLSARLGWEKSLLWASLLLGLVYALCSQAGITLVYSPLITAMLMFSLAGPMIAVLLALEGEGITACVGSEEKAGVSMYFGVYNLVIKCLNGVALLATGILIDLSKGEWGTGAIRFMVIAAGILLFLGVLASQAIRWQGKMGRVTPPSPPATQ